MKKEKKRSPFHLNAPNFEDHNNHLLSNYPGPDIPHGFPGGSNGKESDFNAGDPSSIPGWGRSPGEGNGYSLQYPCRENSMNRGAWQATVHAVAKSQA